MEKLIKILRDLIYDPKQPIHESPQTWGRENTPGYHQTMTYSTTMVPDAKFWQNHDPKGTKYPPHQRAQWLQEAQAQIASGFGTVTAVSYEEAGTPREFPAHQRVDFTLIPPALYNQMFTLGEYEVHIQYECQIDRRQKDLQAFRTKYQAHKNPGYSDAYHHCYHHFNHQWNVIVNYHGLYVCLGKVRIDDSITFYWNEKEHYSNWGWLKGLLCPAKNCVVEEEKRTLEYGAFYQGLVEFFQTLNVETLTLTPSPLDFQDWYDHCQKERPGTKRLDKYTAANLDFEWFVKEQTKDGIYTPTRGAIDRLYNVGGYEPVKYATLDKKLLSKLGIHTVQLKDTVHFSVTSFFDLKGIKIKAPKKVIERYNYEQYCDNPETVTKIKAEEELARKKAELEQYNDTFTLLFHGKEVKVNQSSAAIINYLQNKQSKDMIAETLATVKPMFDAFPQLDKLYLVSFGTYFNMELAGERHYNNETVENEHIPAELWEQMQELYGDCFYCPDEDSLDIMYGWPERGALVYGVQRKGKKGKLEVFTEDYDICL